MKQLFTLFLGLVLSAGFAQKKELKPKIDKVITLGKKNNFGRLGYKGNNTIR